MKLAVLVCLALLAFAANSLFARLALAEGASDALSFSIVRLVSAAVILCALVILRQGRWQVAKLNLRISLLMSGCLLIYAFGFSLAYVSLDAATGALILFACVQMTMLGVGLIKGERLIAVQWFGVSLAIIGILLLILPSASRPSMTGLIYMSLAGLAWAGFSLLGKYSTDALAQSAVNFVLTLPVCALLVGYFYPQFSMSAVGLMAAIASGALASGVGYALWYQVLPILSASNAAILQLLVPILAALMGVVFLQEPISASLLIAAVLVLTGLLVVMSPAIVLTMRAKK